MKPIKLMKPLVTLAFAMAFTLALTACTGNAASSASSSTSSADTSAESSSISVDTQAAYTQALSGRGLALTFVGNDVTDATVANEDEAQAIVESLVERMGGDKTTQLDVMAVFPTETGTTYYVFRQQAGDVMVNGASVKLIVDKNNKVIGLVSAILPDVKLPSADQTSISQEQAEKTAVDELAGSGMTGAKALSEYTTQTVIPVPVLVDKQSGKVAFLGDAKRQILCVDFSEWGENERFASPFEADGESFNDNDVAVYANFIRVYDFFESMGWQGTDDQGTPTLLKMNYKVEDEQAANCTYNGFKNGWETFSFGRANDYGLAIDIVAHEFVHCAEQDLHRQGLGRVRFQ